MRPVCFVAAAICLCAAPPALAGPGKDPRIQTIEFDQGGLIHLATSPDTTQTVLFAPGERIQSVIISDPAAYQVMVAGSGDTLSLKANGRSALAIASVRTSQRSYELELAPGAPSEVASVIRFAYAPAPRQETTQPAPPIVQESGYAWRMSGNKALRPVRIRDDGNRMFIEWSDDQAMPAVFAVGAGGVEQMVDGYVRDGIFTIDRVHARLIFRIDKEKATARRVERKERDG